jgi:hypothetical protein
LITLTQLAASTESAQFSISVIDDEGNSYDPTSDPVYVALGAITSPPTTFDADTATWYAATWSTQAGNPNPVYWINATFGPLNGAIPAAVGSFICYGKITDNPDVPVKPLAYMTFV